MTVASVALDDRNALFDLPVGAPLPGWTARPAPPRTPMQGRFCRVEPLDPARHGEELFAANQLDVEGRNWTYLSYGPFARSTTTAPGSRRSAASDDPLFHAIIDLATGKAVGVASLHAHRSGARRDRGRQHQLLAAAAAEARRHRGDVPDDGARVRRARLPALRVEVRRAQRALARGGGAARASSTRACSGRRSSTRAATATPPGSRSSTANGRR